MRPYKRCASTSLIELEVHLYDKEAKSHTSKSRIRNEKLGQWALDNGVVT
jgi:hypothetical protein